jgi:hypothetical protein
MEADMDMQKAASLFTMLLVGLFLGANLGVLLMCMMRMASPDGEADNELPSGAGRERV